MRNKHEIFSTCKALTQIHISLTKVKLPHVPPFLTSGRCPRDLRESEKSFQGHCVIHLGSSLSLMNRRLIYQTAFCAEAVSVLRLSLSLSLCSLSVSLCQLI